VVAGIGNREDLDVMKNNMLEAYVKLLIYMQGYINARAYAISFPALQLVNLVCLSLVISLVLSTWLVLVKLL
jgi:hypothetical protein